MKVALTLLLMGACEADVAVEVRRYQVFISIFAYPIYAELALWDNELVGRLANRFIVNLKEKEGGSVIKSI